VAGRRRLGSGAPRALAYCAFGFSDGLGAGAEPSAVKIAGDINAKVADGASLDELLARIKAELGKLKPILGPIIDLEVAREPLG
jgi:hypothetical protein